MRDWLRKINAKLAHYFGGDHGHRGSEARGTSGAGAVQGATGSSGGAVTTAGTCADCGHTAVSHSSSSGGRLCHEIGCFCGLSGFAPTARIYTPNVRSSIGNGQEGDGVPVEMRDTEIVAWRAWLLLRDGDDWYLRSFFYPEHKPMRWEGPAVRADKTPTAESAHGIYALTKDRLDAPYLGGIATVAWAQVHLGVPVTDVAAGTHPSDGRYKTEGVVYGEVALSGTVIEGTKGYRAEQAVVRSLTLKLDKAWAVGANLRPLEIMAALEDRYQCPVSLCHEEVGG
jgi:hypothetical protein